MHSPRHRGESQHWRRFNTHVSRVSELSRFREINATAAEAKTGRLGLDDARFHIEQQTQEFADQICAIWDTESIVSVLESQVGLPPVSPIRLSDGRVVETDFNDLRLTHLALTFAKHHRSLTADAPLILEIGGGYGALAAKLARLIPNGRFVLTDLAPAGLLQAYYLNELFPGAVEVIANDEPLPNPRSLGTFTLCSPRTLLRRPTTIGGVINTHSFQEMERRTIRKYFTFIHAALEPGGVFLNVNRTLKLAFRFVDCPYDDDWNLIESCWMPKPLGRIWLLATERRNDRNPAFAGWKDQLPLTSSQPLWKRTVSRLQRLH